METAGLPGAPRSWAMPLGGRGAARASVAAPRPGPATPKPGLAASSENCSLGQLLLAALTLERSLNFPSNLVPVYSTLNDS